MLQVLSLWHLLLFAFVTSSLADWTLDSPTGGAGGLDDPALQLRLDANPILPSTVTDDFSTAGVDGVLNLAKISQQHGNMGEVANVLGTDPSTFESASSSCSPLSSPGKKRRRVRRGDDSTACSAGDMFKNTPSQFKQPGAEPGKKQPPTANPGSTKTPPSANASPRIFIPKLDPIAEELSRIFLPKENRPSEDDYTCRKQGYYIPVCPLDDVQSNGGYVNFLDPCLPGTYVLCFYFISPLLDHNSLPSQSKVSAISLRMHFTNLGEKVHFMDVPEINSYAAPRFAACPYMLSKWCCQKVEIALTVRHPPPPKP